MIDLNLDKIKYGGEYHYYFWDKSFNPVATIEDCLPDCTTFVIGDCGVTGTPRPVSKVVGASEWHNYIANDWTVIPYDINKVKVGDVIEWTGKPHVARVFKIENGVPWVRASFYTGENGTSMIDGKFDTRASFKSLEEVSLFMESKYPSRFYHENSVYDETKAVGVSPAYILSMPKTIAPVERDESVNQIRTTDDTLRIRTSPSLAGSIVGHVQIGYYNVLSIEPALESEKKAYKEQRGRDLNCWYQIATDRWCGDDTAEYLPKKSDSDVTKMLEDIARVVTDLQDRNNQLSEGMRQIAEIARKFI